MYIQTTKYRNIASFLYLSSVTCMRKSGCDDIYLFKYQNTKPVISINFSFLFNGTLSFTLKTGNIVFSS